MPRPKLTKRLILVIADMNSGGSDHKTISLATGFTEDRVKKILSGVGITPHQFDQLNAAKSRTLQTKYCAGAEHHREMQVLVKDCYKTIAKAINGYDENPDLAVKTSWKVLENAGIPVFQQPKIQFGGDDSPVNVAFNSDKGQQALDDVFASIRKTTPDMTQLPAIGTPSKHIRISQAEVVVNAPVTEDMELVEEPKQEGVPA